MTMTAQQLATAIEQHQLRVDRVDRRGGGGGVVVTGKDGGRLHRGVLPTLEEAVEAAVVTITTTTESKLRADKARMFDLLSAGSFYAKSRMVTILPDPPQGEPGGQSKVWDVFDTTTNQQLVDGERSLVAAIIAAEDQIVVPNNGVGGGRVR